MTSATMAELADDSLSPQSPPGGSGGLLYTANSTYSLNTSHIDLVPPLMSTTDPPDDGTRPVWEQTLLGIFLTAIIIISIFGNILVCVAILTDRKLKKVSNLFLISLAISDLVVSCLVMPFAVGNDILQYWPFHSGFCNIWISFDILSATASILNLCAISLDRYVHMRNPFRYEEWMTNRKCLLFIGLIWLASLLISFLPISARWHEIDLGQVTENFSLSNVSETASKLSTIHDTPAQCILELNPYYAFISSTISFYIPCIVMLAIYAKIYQLARHHAKSIKQTQAFDHSNGGKSKMGENKAMFTLGMIMGLFLLSWFPFFIVNPINSLCHCIPGDVFTTFIWLGYVNSTMNPIIYSKFNADFRAAFKRILCCEKCRTGDPYKFNLNSRSKANSNGSTGNNVSLRKVSSNGVTHKNGNSHIGNGHVREEYSQSECRDLIESESFLGKEDINENIISEDETDTRA